MLAIVETKPTFLQIDASIKETFTAIDRFGWQACEDLEILRDNKLYLEGGYRSFEDYCDSELSEYSGYRYVRYLLSAKRVKDSVKNEDLKNVITKPSHTRPLLRLVKTPDKLERAVEIAHQNNPSPTAADFAQAVKLVQNELIDNNTTNQEKVKTQLCQSVKVSSQLSEEQEQLQSINRTWTQAEVEEIRRQMREEFQRERECWRQEFFSGLKAEAEAEARAQIQYELESREAIACQLRDKNAQLQQQIIELEGLWRLKTENEDLIRENERLKDAAQQSALNSWNHTTIFNKQATKILNKDVLEKIEALEPELHLRYLAQGLPSPELRSVVLNLLGQAIAHLIPDGISEYRSKLEHAASWQDFEPVTQEWKSLKHNLWAELTKLERQKITDLKNAPSPPFKVGDRVTYLGDAYDAQSGCVGEVVGTVFSDFKVWWRKYDGSSFESRHSINEIQLEVQRVSA